MPMYIDRIRINWDRVSEDSYLTSLYHTVEGPPDGVHQIGWHELVFRIDR